MKFSINQGELQNALTIVSKGAATHSTLPILSGVYLQTQEDHLIFQTTDLEHSIQYKVPALIEEQGETVVPAKLFTEIAKSLPDAAVHFEAGEGDATLICDSATFSIKTMASIDYPAFPTIDVQDQIEIPFNEFSSMIKRVARVVSHDESRAILTGVLITIENQRLRMVATDSYRLAITESSEERGIGSFTATIAGSFLQEIAGLSPSSDPVMISVSDNQVMVNYQDVIFINRRIEGNFPNYQQLLPDAYSTRVKFDIKQLMAAVKRTSLLPGAASPVKMDVNSASQTIQLSTIAQDVGSAQEMVKAEIEGEDTEIAFNSSYIMDGLNAITTDDAYLEIQNSTKPGIFKAGEGENYLYLIMPVRLSQ